MGNLTDIKTGVIVKVQNQPYLVVWSQFNRKQMRKPVMRTKLKNLIDQRVLEKTFLAGESFEFAEIERRRSQYLYKDGESGHFMDQNSYEQLELPLDQIEDVLRFLKEDTEVYITYYEGKAIGVQPPVKTTLEVMETPPGVKGDTATGGTKPATLETGAVVNVPLFVNIGDRIIVNTETEEYVSRAND